MLLPNGGDDGHDDDDGDGEGVVTVVCPADTSSPTARPELDDRGDDDGAAIAL